jgi:hypothetical protein
MDHAPGEGVDRLRVGLKTALDTAVDAEKAAFDAEKAAAAVLEKAKEVAALASETVRVIDDYTGMVRTILYVLRGDVIDDEGYYGEVMVVTADDDAECLALISRHKAWSSSEANEKLVRATIKRRIMIKPEEKGYLTSSIEVDVVGTRGPELPLD